MVSALNSGISVRDTVRAEERSRTFRIVSAREEIATELRRAAVHANHPFQCESWIAAWFESAAEARAALVVAEHDDGRTACYLPLEAHLHGPVRTLRTVAPRQSPLSPCWFDGSIARALGPSGLKGLRNAIRHALPDIDALVLLDLPLPEDAGEIEATGLPIVQRSRSRQLVIGPDWAHQYETMIPKKRRSEAARRLRKMEREFAPVTFERPQTLIEKLSIIDTMLEDKWYWMDKNGVRGALLQAGSANFYRNLAVRSHQRGDVELVAVALSVGGRRVATNLGIARGERYYGLIMAMSESPVARHGPGSLLLLDLLNHLAGCGIRYIDFGKGEDRFKIELTNASSEIFDTVIALSPLGRSHAWAAGLYGAAKHNAMRSQRLRRIYGAARRTIRHLAWPGGT